MNVKEIMQKVKDFIGDKKQQFNELKKEKKIAIIIGVIAIILAMVFGIMYVQNDKYKVLFSGLDSNDAKAITTELESRKIESKVEGNSIYVPKEQVDKLRLELSSSISNGSKGFEIMDEGSSFGMTDEEFEIKKQRMVQGEIEKTIKTFPQVEDARVHITQGEESVFAKESVPGKAAVYINLKPGSNLEPSQIRSVMSLISASTPNIPKQNIEVIDQNMNLLSEGLFDEKGKVNSTNSSAVDIARNAEKGLSKDLEKSIVSLLEPIFGKGKVKATVNADLNFDSSEKTEVIVDPNKVIKNESRSDNKSTEEGKTGGAVDNNMNNVGNGQKGTNETKEEKIEYEVGKVETKTVKAQGELNKITASVAIDGDLDSGTIKDVKDMVSNTIGMQKDRGDDVAVVGMNFGMNDKPTGLTETQKMEKMLKTTAYVVGGLLLLIAIAIMIMFIIKKRNKNKDDEFDENSEIDMINEKLEEMENNRLNNIEEDEENITLEEEVKIYASENPDQVTELINSWLNE